MKFNKLWIFTILCSVLLLSACGKDESVKADNSEPEIDLSDFPTGVQNGDISVEYYAMLHEAMDKFTNLQSDVKLANSSRDYDSIKSYYREFLMYINGLNYKVLNSGEEEIDRYFTSFLYNAKHNSEYRIKYIDTDSSTDDSVATNYFTDAKNDMMMVIEIMNKYQLFLE